jgi:hypothetical protein
VRNACFELILNFFEKEECTREMRAISCGDQEMSTVTMNLDMSRDDGMDEQGIDWIYGCHLVWFWLRGWTNQG